MHSVHAEMWDPQLLSKHASPLPPRPPSNSRPAHVTTATPAKRITFYKSGDSQFGGVKMAIHKRSFKCFDALLDDLSQKVPLPFGVRTVTTPRGTHAIKHLEQLQDGGCYLCTDRRQTKPVNMELAGKRPSIWYHHSRKPQRPESSSVTPPGHFSYRQRRILLVKNSEPGMRRSVVLSRRSTRSLGAFLDDASEVMQFHVRKLYTAEGRRIDNVQSLMTCPGVLVCVGREAFSPMLVNFIRKSSEEKLPGLGSRSPGLGRRTPGNGARSPATQGARSSPHGAQSRASEYSEVHESKKNVNFGLETKKSIIHPRSDSSNRSTRFSLSSEKSYGNGVSGYSQGRPAIINDDIEKRVLVNKDGSLSVEMRVRFRLHNDETLQWSTQVKKSPSLTNECCPLSQAQPHYLQGQSESCSDPDSTSYEPEGVDYSNQPRVEGNRCPCCYQRREQQYDLWENPAHCRKHPPVPPPHTSSHTHTITRHTHSSSSSSSCNSRRVVRCRARVGGGSEPGQMLQEEMFVTEQVERRVEVEQDGDTRVEVCRVSRGCSHSEVVAIDNNVRPVEEVMMEEERPLSAISSSSHVLQALKEDHDDDLPPSASQCCHSTETSPTLTSQTLDEKPTCNISVHSTEHKEEEGGRRAASAASSCHCGAATEDRAPSSLSKRSSGSRRSCKAKIPNSEEEMAADEDEDEDEERVVSSLSGHSLQSKVFSVCSNCGGCKHGVNSDSYSRASQRSHHSHHASPTPPSSRENTNNGSDGDGSEGSAGSTQSNKTNLTNNGRCSVISNILDGGESGATSNPEAGKEEERATSATSYRSNRSRKSGCNSSTCVAAGKKEERSPSAMSAQSNMSAKSHKSNCTAEGENTRARTSLSNKSGASAKTSASVKIRTDNTAVEEEDTNKRTPSALSVKPSKAERPDSVLSAKSAKSNVSAKSGTSHRSTCSHCVRAVSAGAKEAEPEATGEEEGIEAEERAASAMSAKSNLSDKSNKSHKSSKALERSLSPRPGTGEDEEERAASQVSNKSSKSNVTVKSSKLCKANGNESVESPSSEEKENEDVKDEQQRPESVISAKSASSAKSHHTNGDIGLRVASPGIVDRTLSAMSQKSHTSAKSSKSQKSNRATASPNPKEADIPIETNGKEEQNENQERVASSMSVKSKSSARSRTSNKSSKNLKPVTPSPNVVTIKTPEGFDEDGNEATERAPSAASAKSGKSNVSKKSNHNRTANLAVIEPADENVVEDDAPRSKPQGQMLSPRTHSRKAASPSIGVGETRGPSALSVHSTKSTKSGKSKCGCGAASALDEAKKEQEGENDEDEELKSEKASEQTASISSTKRQRRESGDTEQPLSRNSSGSISLGLPEDQETADSDSGKSSVSFHINTERKARGKTATPQGTGAIMSQNSSRKSTRNRPAVDIPTINTPGGSEVKGEEGGEQTTARGASALSAKSSSRSHKSSSQCGVQATVKGAVKDLETDAPDNRTSSAMSSASDKVRSKSSACDCAKKDGDSGDNDPENQAMSRPASKAKGEEGIADNKVASVHSKSACCLRPESAVSAQSGSKMKASKESKADGSVKDCKAKSSGSVKSSKSQKKDVKAQSPCPSHGSKLCSKVETHSKSTPPHSLSAADLLKETMAAARPHSRHTRESKTRRNQEELEITPACLPNASPNEVVSDWLRSIPNSMLLIEPNEEEGEQDKVVEEKPGGDEESPEEEKGGDEEEKAEAEEKQEEAAESADPAPGDAVEASSRVLTGDSLPRSWHSSAAVMKVLLSSSLGRCQSLPEVSPVYGRRLSMSARGLLDCLTQLQLIEPAVSPGFDQQKRYEDIMVILQSLWLTEQAKDVGKEQVTPPRSSSGLGMSSGSGGSGKENGNQGGDETKQDKTKETSLHKGAEKVVEEKEEGNAAAGPEEPVQSEDQSTVLPSLDSPKASENPSSSDKSSANDSSKSPTDNERDTMEDSSSGTPPTVVRAPLSKRLSQDPDPVWVLHLLKKLEKQFMNHYITAMAEFKVRWHLDDSLILDTMIGELRDEVNRRIQGSIQREVKKIQSRAGRAERSPRPPQRGNLSRESTMTEKRRQILKVMKNQSVKTDSQSDGELTGEFSDQRSEEEYCPCDACVRKKMAIRPLKANPLAAEAPVMMEFDLLKILQLKKSPLPLPAVVPQPADEEGDSEVAAEEGRNLEVVQEEEEEDETKEDIEAKIVLDETIPEEDEEENEAGEEEEVETQKEESSAGDEEQEEGEEAGETSENGEEEEECQCQCARNEEESDKAEEGEEGTAGEDFEETSDNTAEGETGEEEEGEERDEETVKEATAGETTESGEEVSEFKEEEEEEEESTGRESGEEKASGETEEDNAAKNEDSTLTEEREEGNVSASAEDEDDGEGDSHEDENGGESGEQGGEASEEERASSQCQGVTVTEGEEADAEDSDTDVNRPSDTSAESGREGAGGAGDEEEEEKEDGGDGDAVEEFKPEEEKVKKREDGALLHQFTKTSVESQPGSLEDVDTESPHHPVISIEVPKMAAGGGTGQRRSRSPGRVKCRKHKECDVDLEDF